MLAAVRDGMADEPELFASMFVAVVDSVGDRLTYVNAGHPPPIMVSLDGVTELAPTGPLVSGVLTDATWSVAECPFRPGDLLVAYSDGLLEARDDDGLEFGSAGVAAVLQGHAGGPPATITTQLRTAARDHARLQRDDVTVLVARRT